MSFDPTHWRSASQYDYVETLTAPDLAWEWLRRNAGYQRDYVSARRKKEDPHELTRTVRQSWGLRFPGRSATGRSGSRGLLATRYRSRNGHFERRPANCRSSDNIAGNRPGCHAA